MPNKYSFTKDESEFLNNRQTVLDLLAMQHTDTTQAIQNYIVNTVAPRVGVDLEKNTISYSIRNAELTVNEITATEPEKEEAKPDEKAEASTEPAAA